MCNSPYIVFTQLYLAPGSVVGSVTNQLGTFYLPDLKDTMKSHFDYCSSKGIFPFLDMGLG